MSGVYDDDGELIGHLTPPTSRTIHLDPSSSRSFTPLSTIALHSPHILHPGSCNPTMDLVVLLAPAQPDIVVKINGDKKGKGKARAALIMPDMSNWRGTKVVLWRMLGSKVWEIETRGHIAGLAWSGDGLYLSLLIILISARKAVLEHRSVHTGEVVKVVPIDLPGSIWDQGMIGDGIQMDWRENGLNWEKPSDGSARNIISSLPTVTAVEPPKPAVLNPFAKQSAASTSKLPHPSLSTFPSLLSSTPALPPHTLHISFPGQDIRLLTGSFPCDTELTPSHLRLAQTSDILSDYLNIVMRGLEAIEAGWREGYKQTMIWREELEECGKLQGMSVKDVHADLFRLLMTGRCREAVSEWLGNKLTGRMLTKWEQSLSSSFLIIQKIIIESVSPALERIMILLHELRGWNLSPKHSVGLELNLDGIDQCINLTKGMIGLIERMRQDAEHETLASVAWISWLKYETAQTGSGGGDEPHIAVHDLKLTWSFLVNGFVRSIFSTYFPDNTPTRPPTDILPNSFILSLRPNPISVDIDTILSETISKLSGRSTRTIIPSPQVDQEGEMGEEAMSLDQSSMMLSSPVDRSREMDDSAVDLDMDSGVVDESGIVESDDDDDIEKKGEEEGLSEVERNLELEPWVWANSLIVAAEGLIRTAVGTQGNRRVVVEDEDEERLEKEMMCIWRNGTEVWGASISDDGTYLSLVLIDPTSTFTPKLGVNLSVQPFSQILAIQFFDNTELALVLASPEGKYLLTTDFRSYFHQMIPLPPIATAEDVMGMEGRIPVGIRRSRYLGPNMITPEGEILLGYVGLALNGRKGRRVGCVIGTREGGEVEVWDMEGDEDEDEDEEDEENGDEDGEDEAGDEGYRHTNGGDGDESM